MLLTLLVSRLPQYWVASTEQEVDRPITSIWIKLMTWLAMNTPERAVSPKEPTMMLSARVTR